MDQKRWVAGAVAFAVLAGVLHADKPKPAPKPATPTKPATCEVKPQVKPGKVTVESGNVKVELKLSGEITSGPKGTDTLSPTVNVKAFLMWKKGGDKWQRADLAPTEVALGQVKAGSSLKIDKSVELPGAAAVADSGVVDYELHFFMTGGGGKMVPLAHFVSFQISFGSKEPAVGTPKLSNYTKKKSPDKKAVMVSDASQVGWFDGPDGTPYSPAGA